MRLALVVVDYVRRYGSLVVIAWYNLCQCFSGFFSPEKSKTFGGLHGTTQLYGYNSGQVRYREGDDVLTLTGGAMEDHVDRYS